MEPLNLEDLMLAEHGQDFACWMKRWTNDKRVEASRNISFFFHAYLYSDSVVLFVHSVLQRDGTCIQDGSCLYLD